MPVFGICHLLTDVSSDSSPRWRFQLRLHPSIHRTIEPWPFTAHPFEGMTVTVKLIACSGTSNTKRWWRSQQKKDLWCWEWRKMLAAHISRFISGNFVVPWRELCNTRVKEGMTTPRLVISPSMKQTSVCIQDARIMYDDFNRSFRILVSWISQQILRDGHISILDFGCTILDHSQLGFAVNRDRIYYSSKEEKEKGPVLVKWSF